MPGTRNPNDVLRKRRIRARRIKIRQVLRERQGAAPAPAATPSLPSDPAPAQP